MTGFYTLFHKELLRFWKVSFQTVLAPVLTTLLYLLIFCFLPKITYFSFRERTFIYFSLFYKMYAPHDHRHVPHCPGKHPRSQTGHYRGKAGHHF